MERFTSFDFGLSELASRFHEDWSYMGGVEEVVYSYLSLGEATSADGTLRKEAAALDCDVAELDGSSLSDDRIEMLFSMSTSWNYHFRDDETGRMLLRRIRKACQRWQAIYGRVPVEVDAAWLSPVAVDELCSVIAETSLQPTRIFRRYLGRDMSELRDALDVCARSASADLAFRLLLRIHVANLIPVERSAWIRYKEIARRLALGEDLLSSVEFLSPGEGFRSN